MTLTGDLSGHTGTTRIYAGMLKGGVANAFGVTSPVEISAGANLDLGGFNQSIGTLLGGGNVINSGAGATLSESNAATTLFSGAISGAVGLSKAGAGILQLSGVNNYTLNTVINAGVLALTGAGSIANSALVSVGAGAALNLAGLSGGSATIQNLSLSGAGELRLGGKLLSVALAENDAGPGGTIVGSALADSIQFILNSLNFSLAATSFSAWTDGVDQITIDGSFLDDNITGSSRADTINGVFGSDVIDGGGGNDTLNGGDGFDTLHGGAGADILNGGIDNDEFVYFSDTEIEAGESVNGGGGGGDAIIVEGGFFYDLAGVTISGVEALRLEGGFASLAGTQIGAGAITQVTGDASANEISVFGAAVNLSGVTFSTWSDAADRIAIFGTAGSDSLTGSGQADALSGGAGADTLNGGGGDDFFSYVSASDLAAGETINGGAGAADQIFLSGSNIYNLALAAINGVEQLRFNSGASASLTGGQIGAGFITAITGSAFLDTLTVSGAAVNLSGVAFTTWTSGTDVITINGTAGADNLTGSSQNDTLIGFGGVDNMAGGTGDDRYFVDAALDAVNELAGAGNGSDSIFATVSYTIALNVERLFLQGTAISATSRDGQNDYLYGNALNNILDGKSGTDNLNGGLGNDSYYVNTSADVVNEAAGAGTLDTIFAQSSYMIAANVERLFLIDGGNYNASGRNGQDDFLAGNAGNNIINGFSGNDTIRGGLGNDTLTGGAGLDIFQFLTEPNSAANRDVITDFNIADDTIQMDNAVYTLLGANGALAANLFRNLLTAQDADDRILYDQANGNLYYDTNGLTAGGVIHFAEVTNGLALTAADFVVV